MNFGQALEQLKSVRRVQRAGWNGKGMWLQLVVSWVEAAGSGLPSTGERLPFIAMYTAQGDLVPWLASQTDILAEDWSVVD